MGKLTCADFGFDCKFETDEGSDSDTILNQFAEHMKEVHGIEYSLEELRQMPVWNR